jgi:ribosomal protein S1
LHAKLQAKYVHFLRNKTDGEIRNIQENIAHIDLQYQRNGRVIFSEIKPTEKIETKYAIRIAVGQLLEYQFLKNRKALLEIVLGREPKSREKKFINNLGMILTYYDPKGDTFLTT